MKLSHVGIVANDIEALRYWYMRYFALTSSELYRNEDSGVSCYFLSWPDSDASVEILAYDKKTTDSVAGHVAIAAGSREGVRFLTELLRTDGNPVISEPAETVVGTYMSACLDPEGNRVEIVDR
jgi:lactoylglutathione lyase